MVFIPAALPWLYLPDGCLWDFSFYDLASVFLFLPELLGVAPFLIKFDQGIFLFLKKSVNLSHFSELNEAEFVSSVTTGFTQKRCHSPVWKDSSSCVVVSIQLISLSVI